MKLCLDRELSLPLHKLSDAVCALAVCPIGTLDEAVQSALHAQCKLQYSSEEYGSEGCWIQRSEPVLASSALFSQHGTVPPIRYILYSRLL